MRDETNERRYQFGVSQRPFKAGSFRVEPRLEASYWFPISGHERQVSTSAHSAAIIITVINHE
jgi:hypothetical protein